MPGATSNVPLLSIVIPTYNRAALLDRTLSTLARQTSAPEDFEVVVSDDGSNDSTRDVVRSYEDRLRMRYVFQEDLGYRVASARNGGARVASAPLLAFLDTGVLAGPQYVESVLAAHAAPAPAQVVFGYTYGYDPRNPHPELHSLVTDFPPEEAVRKVAGASWFQDMRLPEFAAVDFDLSRMVMPWLFFWTLNVSMPAADFWRVGGFDEDFTGWGGEDIELGFRLHNHGLPMTISRESWGIEAPHERTPEANISTLLRNCDLFIRKHPSLLPELFWAVTTRGIYGSVETERLRFEEWANRARGQRVSAEIESGLNTLPPLQRTQRVAVFGSGTEGLPAAAPKNVELFLCDFDEGVLARQESRGGDAVSTWHLSGLRTPWPDQHFDLVIITSRMDEPRQAWGEAITKEARRIAGSVVEPSLRGD
ncbi:glycosyltransferase [Streptomyces sp. MK37H]|uniref:glycosyltransferase n=1 Tax=Streptomyces sp. MK37H TaxID=2699117 RepID=UPI001B384FF8|nr:glycosyltransferase [Streptomyces sp. MK37H]MBP8533227.1 glycosyltransferase [Streptomyces sp. MK37H]